MQQLHSEAPDAQQGLLRCPASEIRAMEPPSGSTATAHKGTADASLEETQSWHEAPAGAP